MNHTNIPDCVGDLLVQIWFHQIIKNTAINVTVWFNICLYHLHVDYYINFIC